MNNVKRNAFMHNLKRPLVAVAALSVSMAALTPIAFARSVGGFGGHAHDPSQQANFSEFWNGVTYTGSGATRWDIPLVIDDVGPEHTFVYAFVNGVASSVSCSVQAVSQDASFISNTALYSPNIGNAWTSIALPTVTTISNGSLEMGCLISNGSRVQTVTW